jgi:hypothetical protein
MTLALMSSNVGASSSVGYGSRLTQFRHRFPAVTTACGALNCFGPTVKDSSAKYEFTYLTTLHGRVDGFDLALPRGTSLVRAELTVASLLPADAVMGYVDVIHHDALGNSCAVYNLSSKSIEQLFGTTKRGAWNGNVGVELTNVGPHGTTRYLPTSIDVALVVPSYVGGRTVC